MDGQLHDEASHVTAEDAEVHVDGPNGVAVALTPEAALETADRLTDGARDAAGQRHFKETGKKAKSAERYDD